MNELCDIILKQSWFYGGARGAKHLQTKERAPSLDAAKVG